MVRTGDAGHRGRSNGVCLGESKDVRGRKKGQVLKKGQVRYRYRPFLNSPSTVPATPSEWQGEVTYRMRPAGDLLCRGLSRR